MSDHVSWGLYIANFTFAVGLAAGAVMMVIPAYLYDDHEMHDVVIIGELLAVAAIVVCLALRRRRHGPARPLLAHHPRPRPLQLARLHAHLGRHRPQRLPAAQPAHLRATCSTCASSDEAPNPRWYVPFVFLSIGWAISIHTVTAFLYCGLGGRPFWNSALLAPRFIASAFVTGPAFIIVLLQVLRRFSSLPSSATARLRTLTRSCGHRAAQPLHVRVRGLHRVLHRRRPRVRRCRYLSSACTAKSGLVPWIWTAIGLNVAVRSSLSSIPRTPRRTSLLDTRLRPGLHRRLDREGHGPHRPGLRPQHAPRARRVRLPTLAEWKVTAGIWAPSRRAGESPRRRDAAAPPRARPANLARSRPARSRAVAR
jgi:hypothetical protein